MATAEIRRHWDRVAGLGCIVTGVMPATIHHIHGGSVAELGIQKGMGQKPNDWLVIPVCYDLHVGRQGIDSGVGVRTWEKQYGRQVDFLDEVCRRLGINVWLKAGIQREVD
jgi:hypothetical protein